MAALRSSPFPPVALAHAEVLAKLRGVDKDAVFAETLPREWRPVRRSLYDALRNGIVHGYATKTLRVDGSPVGIGVSWRDHPHLSLDPARRTVFLNVETMAADLRRAFENYEAELLANADARERFLKSSRSGTAAPFSARACRACACSSAQSLRR